MPPLRVFSLWFETHSSTPFQSGSSIFAPKTQRVSTARRKDSVPEPPIAKQKPEHAGVVAAARLSFTTVSKDISKAADTAAAPVQHRLGTPKAP